MAPSGSCPTLLRRVMSFERTNLGFTVRKKCANLAANFKELLEKAGAGAGAGAREARAPADVSPTIVYTLTRKEAQEVAAALQVREWDWREGNARYELIQQA